MVNIFRQFMNPVLLTTLSLTFRGLQRMEPLAQWLTSAQLLKFN